MRAKVCPECGAALGAEGCPNCLSPPPKEPYFSVLSLVVVVVLISVMASILVPNFLRARARGQLTACKSNCKNIGTALEMYSTDNQARYPVSLSQLVPKYLKTIPTCPSAGQVTYGNYVSASEPDVYTFCCAGENHRSSSTAPNYPQFNAVQGLIER